MIVILSCNTIFHTVKLIFGLKAQKEFRQVHLLFNFCSFHNRFDKICGKTGNFVFNLYSWKKYTIVFKYIKQTIRFYIYFFYLTKINIKFLDGLTAFKCFKKSFRLTIHSYIIFPKYHPFLPSNVFTLHHHFSPFCVYIEHEKIREKYTIVCKLFNLCLSELSIG